MRKNDFITFQPGKRIPVTVTGMRFFHFLLDMPYDMCYFSKGHQIMPKTAGAGEPA